MELRHLQYFLMVAREGTISGAAHALHLSQPSLSRQMQDLPYGELDEVLDALLAARPRRPLTDLHPRQSDVRQRVFGMEFKRRQEPQPLYVSDKPFGRSWTVPLVGHFNLP